MTHAPVGSFKARHQGEVGVLFEPHDLPSVRKPRVYFNRVRPIPPSTQDFSPIIERVHRDQVTLVVLIAIVFLSLMAVAAWQFLQ